VKSLLIRASACAGALSVLAGCSGGDENGTVGGEPLPIPVASFAVASSSVNEGAQIEVQVTLSSPAPGNVLIPFTMTGSATSGIDFTTGVSPLVIPVGRSSGTIFIGAIDDFGDEPDEGLTFTMGTPTHATVGAISSTSVTIVDMDVPTVAGRVTDSVSGVGLEGVTVRVGTTTTTTDENGQYTLAGFPSAPSVLVSFDNDGYAPQGRVVDSVSMANAPLNIPMVKEALVQTFSPAQPAVIAVPNSTAQVSLPANSLRTADGSMPTGNVTAVVTPVLPASNLDVMPGNYLGMSGSIVAAPIESFGALDVRFTDANGASLNLADGMSATLRIAASSRVESLPSNTPLFHYDAALGVWRQDGTATLRGTTGNQYYEGVVTHFTTWNADTTYPTVNVTGCVQDAMGTRVPDAVVSIEGRSYASKLTTVTDAEGTFTLRAKPSNLAFLQAIKGTAVSNSPSIDVQSANMTVTPCLVLSGTNLSIKLSWGALPLDLDSHTLGANPDDHVYYIDKGSLSDSPYIALDVDDVNGFGPEVTTFARLARNRRYSFYVHNFSQTFDPGQTASPARVEITNGGSQRVFTPPVGETNQTLYWHVFDITTNNNCAPTIVPVQRFSMTEPTNSNVGNGATYCD